MILRSKKLGGLLPLALVAGVVIAGPAPVAHAKMMSCPELAPDTIVRVRVLQDIDSGRSKVGDTFDAAVEDGLTVDGKVVVKPDTPAKVRLIRLLQPKGSHAAPALALRLVALRLDGKSCPVITGIAEISSRAIRESVRLPEGTTSEKEILDALSQEDRLGQSVGAAVNGAGVSFEVASGNEVRLSRNVTLRFEVADVASLK